MNTSFQLSIVSWALAAFFLAGGFVNFRAPPAIAAQYRKWGYPDWFHFVTATLEFATAILLMFTATRWLGASLGVAIMLAATITVVAHREHARALLPMIVLSLSAVAGWLTIP
jgi:uncharacterized membrane protein YphA (DoxX/SURF4 family)